MKKILTTALLATALGCSTWKGGTVTDGVSLNAGIKFPNTSATTFQLISYVNGCTFAWESDCELTYDRTTVTSSELFGIWNSTSTNKTSISLMKK